MRSGTFTFTWVNDMRRVRVESDSNELFAKLLEIYTVPNPNLFYLQHRGIDNVDETLSVVSATGTFKVGLFPMVYSSAVALLDGDASRIRISDSDKDEIRKRISPLHGVFAEDHQIRQLSEKKPLRYYQSDAVRKLLKYGRGICVSPTASGKSLIIGTLVNELRLGADRIGIFKDKPYFLLIVPTRGLVDQMFDDLVGYGIGDVCMWTSNSGKKSNGTFKDNSCKGGFKHLIITNHAWLNKEIAKKNKDFPLRRISCVFADEVHTVGHKTDILKNVEKINPELRFGFTGTLPSFIFSKWCVIGAFGNVVYSAEIKKFQDEGFLSKLNIQPVHGEIRQLLHNRSLPYSINTSCKLGQTLDDGSVIDVNTAIDMEHQFLELNATDLYSAMFDAIEGMFDFHNRNMIVIFDRTAIGKSICELLKTKLDGISKIHYIDGSVDISVRESIRRELEETNGNVLVAQAVTAATGMNIVNQNGIAFAFTGRSFVRVIQSIGRVIRLKEDRSSSTLFELYFNTRYSTQHHDDKMSIFRQQYGSDCVLPEKVVRID